MTIFRAVNNFVFVGDDGKTPAMRLGFAKQPLDFEDIVWPGQAGAAAETAAAAGKEGGCRVGEPKAISAHLPERRLWLGWDSGTPV